MKARKRTGDDKGMDRAAAAAKRREEENALFNQLCEIARKRNGDAFKSLFHDHYTKTKHALSFDFVPRHERGLQDKATVMRVMAEEGNDKAVIWLATEFDISLAQAVEGYARVGKEKDVDSILYNSTFNVEAVRGYAFNGNVEQVGRLMKVRSVDPKVAAYGYGRGGHLDALKALSDLYKGNDKLVIAGIEGLAYSQHIKCVEDFILHAAPGADTQDLNKYFVPVFGKKDDFSKYCAAAVECFGKQDYLSDQNKFLELMATLQSDLVKGYVMGFLTSNRNVERQAVRQLGIHPVELAKEADTIRAEMTAHECNFADARAHLAEQRNLEKVEQEVKEPVSAEAEATASEDVKVDGGNNDNNASQKADADKPELAKSDAPSGLRAFFGLHGKPKGQQVAEQKQAAEVAQKVSEDAANASTASVEL